MHPRRVTHRIFESPAEGERITVSALTGNESDPFGRMLKQFRRQLDPELLDQPSGRDARVRIQELSPDRFRRHPKFRRQRFQGYIFRKMPAHIIADPVEQIGILIPDGEHALHFPPLVQQDLQQRKNSMLSADGMGPVRIDDQLFQIGGILLIRFQQMVLQRQK